MKATKYHSKKKSQIIMSKQNILSEIDFCPV